MSLNNTYRISKLISKYILEDITASEKVELRTWLNASKKNKMLFNEFRQKHFFKNKQDLEKTADYQAAWQEFLVRKHSSNQASRFNRPMWAISVPIAATLLIALGISFYLRAPNPTSPLFNKETVETILPGNKQATLTLADGRQVFLSDTNRQVLQEMGLPQIQLTDTGVLYIGNPMQNGHPALYNELETPPKGEFALTLSDGTRVWLNSESRLKYPVNFTDSERHVMLEGEAYFEVAKNEKLPFIVEIGNAQVQVLGTSFNVKGYRNEAHIYTTLVEGKVRLRTSKYAVDLAPNEQGIIDLQSLGIDKKNVNVQLYTGWQRGRFIFDSQPLGEIMDNMSRWYGIQVVFTDPAVKNIPFSGNLKRYDKLNTIIRMLEKTEDITFKQKGGTLYIGK